MTQSSLVVSRIEDCKILESKIVTLALKHSDCEQEEHLNCTARKGQHYVTISAFYHLLSQVWLHGTQTGNGFHELTLYTQTIHNFISLCQCFFFFPSPHRTTLNHFQDLFSTKHIVGGPTLSMGPPVPWAPVQLRRLIYLYLRLCSHLSVPSPHLLSLSAIGPTFSHYFLLSHSVSFISSHLLIPLSHIFTGKSPESRSAAGAPGDVVWVTLERGRHDTGSRSTTLEGSCVCACMCVCLHVCESMHVCTIIRALQPVSHKAAAAQDQRLETCTILDAISEWLDGWMAGRMDG